MKIQNAPSGYSEILESIYDNYSQWVVANIKKIKSERDVLPILLDFSGAKAETEEIAMALARKLGLKIYVGEFSFTSFFGLSNNLGWQSLIPKSFAGNRLYWAIFLKLIKEVEFPAVAEAVVRRSLNPERISVPLLDRSEHAAKFSMICGVYFQLLSEARSSPIGFRDEWKKLTRNKKESLRIILQDSIKKCSAEVRKLLKDGEAKIYRGFEVDYGQSIRVGRFKINNPKANVFEPAYGISYTNNKDLAFGFANARNTPVLDASWRERIESSRLLFSAFGEGNPFFNDEAKRRKVLGEFDIGIEDIIICQFGISNEDEIIAFPDDVRIIKYSLV